MAMITVGRRPAECRSSTDFQTGLPCCRGCGGRRPRSRSPRAGLLPRRADQPRRPRGHRRLSRLARVRRDGCPDHHDLRPAGPGQGDAVPGSRQSGLCVSRHGLPPADYGRGGQRGAKQQRIDQHAATAPDGPAGGSAGSGRARGAGCPGRAAARARSCLRVRQRRRARARRPTWVRAGRSRSPWIRPAAGPPRSPRR